MSQNILFHVVINAMEKKIKQVKGEPTSESLP